MIVKCEQCQTRFKVPDDKVTEKGVKVRCTKCGNTFRVMKDGSQQASAPPGGAPAPPPSGLTATFPTVPAPVTSTEADPFAKFGAPSAPDLHEATRPGVFALGVEATRSPDLAPPAPFDFAALTPSPPEPSGPPSSSPFDFGSLTPPPPESVTARVPAMAERTAKVPAMADRTAQLPALPQMQPPPPPPPSAPTQPGTAPFDFSAVVPQSPGGGDAFDFAGIAPPPPAVSAPSAPTMPEVPAAGQDTLPPLPSSERTQRAALSDLLGDLPPMDFGAPPSDAATASMPALPQSSAPAGDDFFVSTGDLGDGDAPGGGVTETRDSLFDMQAVPRADEAPPADAESGAKSPAAPAGAVVARIQLVKAPAGAEAAAAAAMERMQPPPRRGAVVGIVVNLVIAVVLVGALLVVGSVYVNDGTLDPRSFSWEGLKSLAGPPADYVAGDISNGLYDTRGGRPVFFVHGEVVNRGEAAVRLKVVAEILDGDQLVRAGEVLAGVQPTPEELYDVGASDELERLAKRLSDRAVPVAPGASAPFTVTFYEYPPDLKAFRVRVSVVPVAGGETAKRP